MSRNYSWRCQKSAVSSTFAVGVSVFFRAPVQNLRIWDSQIFPLTFFLKGSSSCRGGVNLDNQLHIKMCDSYVSPQHKMLALKFWDTDVFFCLHPFHVSVCENKNKKGWPFLYALFVLNTVNIVLQEWILWENIVTRPGMLITHLIYM